MSFYVKIFNIMWEINEAEKSEIISLAHCIKH